MQLFFTQTGMTSDVPINNVLLASMQPVRRRGSACDDAEQVLDIAEIGMAPGITQVLFYESNVSGPDMLNRMATDNLAKVLSSSWGSTDLGHNCDPIFAEFQAQGQTYLNAVGDMVYTMTATSIRPRRIHSCCKSAALISTTSGPGGPWANETARARFRRWVLQPGELSDPDRRACRA
ncbi:MAG: hypothetical protein U1F23_00025 [Lysobacterales bacterium]